MPNNTHSDFTPSTAQKLQAKLALLASRGDTGIEGKAPSLEELALLLEDRLEFERKQQVYQYLNSDEQLFAQWVALIEARETLINKPTVDAKPTLWQRFGQWLTPSRMTFVGSATAGVFAIAIITPALLTTDTVPLSPQQPSSETRLASDSQSANLDKPAAMEKPRQRPASPPRPSVTEPSPPHGNQASTSTPRAEKRPLSSVQVNQLLRQGFAQAWAELETAQQQRLNIEPPMANERILDQQHPQLIALGRSLVGVYLQCLEDSQAQPDRTLTAELEDTAPWLLENQNLCGNLSAWITP